LKKKQGTRKKENRKPIRKTALDANIKRAPKHETGFPCPRQELRGVKKKDLLEEELWGLRRESRCLIC